MGVKREGEREGEKLRDREGGEKGRDGEME